MENSVLRLLDCGHISFPIVLVLDVRVASSTCERAWGHCPHVTDGHKSLYRVLQDRDLVLRAGKALTVPSGSLWLLAFSSTLPHFLSRSATSQRLLFPLSEHQWCKHILYSCIFLHECWGCELTSSCLYRPLLTVPSPQPPIMIV